MTSIPANVQNYSAGNRSGQSKVQMPGAKEDFGKVLDKQKTGTSRESSVKTPKQTQGSTDETVKTQGSMETSQEAETDKVMQAEGGEKSAGETVDGQEQQPETTETPEQSETAAVDKTVESDMPEEGLKQAMEVLQSAIVQIQELLMQQLNITPQELEQLMRQEGFTDVDLLQPEAVGKLILDATGAEDSMALVMDENLYQSQQAITQGYQEITQALETELKEEGGLHKALENLESSVSNQAVQEPDAAENLRQEDQQQSGRDREHENAQDQSHSQNVTGQVLYQNYTSQAQNQPVAGQTGAAALPSGATQTQDAQQVMNQILDYMRVSMKPESTVLNMQLHPENLGTLHIQISAREGIMTAHFTATSEAVKTVLENQLAVLRENFEQQDIKVDAIEVTVETHQFESNLEQGRNRGEEEQNRKPRRRRLDVSGLESEEELNESDQIITEMMAANGSSVDYLV